MEEEQKYTYFTSFNKDLHRIGKISLTIALFLLLGFPFFIGLFFESMPSFGGFMQGIAKVGLIYYPVAIVEFLVYAPMLGAGGSYVAFLTGNITNLKIPCAMNARDIAKTEVGTPENEIISTLSTAISALVTTIVILIGVLLITPLTPILQNPVLTPAFDTVVPALFGALGLKYFLKSPKIAIIPLLLMTTLCVTVPSMISQTSILIIPAGGLALAVGYFLFRKNKL